MSNRERIIELLDVIPDYKIGYVLAYVQGVAADEEADDAFCQRMVENYENAPDEDKEGIPLEDCMKEWGLAWCIVLLLRRKPKSSLTSYPWMNENALHTQ